MSAPTTTPADEGSPPLLMGRRAGPRGSTWQQAVIAAVHEESETATTLTLQTAAWSGHVPGQHVDVRLTAPDGYRAVRPYSIASSPTAGQFDITVAEVEAGEVSQYLARDAAPGAHVEVRGPLGGWFVWDPASAEPVQLIGGGVGVVPLMSMLRARSSAPDPPGAERGGPMRLLYSARNEDAVLYKDDLWELSRRAGAAVRIHLTRARQDPNTGAGPFGAATGRLTMEQIETAVWPVRARPRTYVCGPTGFVEHVLEILQQIGHDPAAMRAERFG